jgi:hypothetical protein
MEYVAKDTGIHQFGIADITSCVYVCWVSFRNSIRLILFGISYLIRRGLYQKMCKSTESFNDAINVAIHQAHIVLKSIDNNASSVEEEMARTTRKLRGKTGKYSRKRTQNSTEIRKIAK